MKHIELIKRVLFLPIAVVIFIPAVVLGFFATDWTDFDDREFFKRITIGMFKIYD